MKSLLILIWKLAITGVFAVICLMACNSTQLSQEWTNFCVCAVIALSNLAIDVVMFGKHSQNSRLAIVTNAIFMSNAIIALLLIDLGIKFNEWILIVIYIVLFIHLLYNNPYTDK